MTAADLPAAHALSVQLKWPHRLDDWAMLQRVSAGFVVLDGERLIGTAFACPQGDFATIGLVIVSDDYQGKGIGRQLMEQALDACQARTPMLNATSPVRHCMPVRVLSSLAGSSNIRARRTHRR